MAATWGYTSQGIAYANLKHMIDIFNDSSSTRYIRVREIVFMNNVLTAVTGVILQCQIMRSTATPSAGTNITALSRDSANSALNANTTGGTGRTLTVSGVYRRFVFVNEEPIVGGTAPANWFTLAPFCLVWPPTVGDTNLQPLTCNASTAEGWSVQNQTNTAVGGADAEIWFTNEAS